MGSSIFVSCLLSVLVLPSEAGRTVGFPASGTPRENAAAVQAAVDAVSAAGGGRVSVPPGDWTCGTIWLKSGVDLHLEKGAVIRGSTNFNDYCAADAYPQNSSSPKATLDLDGENMSGGHLLVCLEQRNVTLSGAGAVNGSGSVFATYPDGSERPHQKNYDWRPGQMLHVCESDRVTIRDVRLENAPYWCLFIHGCEDVAVSNVTIRQSRRNPRVFNADGIDIDSSRRVLVEDCDIAAYDDGITFRGNAARLKRKGPCEDVTVRNCRVSSYMNALRFGVGTEPVRRIRVRGLDIHDTRTAVNFCPAWAGRGGTPISDVEIEGLAVQCKDFLRMHRFGAKTPLTDVTIRGVKGRTKWKSMIYTLPELPFERIRLLDIDLEQVERGIQVVNVKDFELTGNLEAWKMTPEEKRRLEREIAEGKRHLY